MVVIIDTCSLVELSRYYLPFDEDHELLTFMESRFLSGDIILLDCILEECRLVANGLAVKSMPFLVNEVSSIATNDLLIPSPRRFYNLLDNQFCVNLAKRQLSDHEYLLAREDFLKSGDGRVILYIENQLHKKVNVEDILLVTEETRQSNDGKLFKKLPSICDLFGIRTQNIASYLISKGVRVNWEVPCNSSRAF